MMGTRSRKADIKTDRNDKRTEPAKTVEKRDVFASLGLGRSQSWLIGTVASLTAATLILNGDGLTFEGDNILVALIWSLLAAGLLFVRCYRNKPFSFDACDNGDKSGWSSACPELVWSHRGNQVATNGSGKTPDQFANWSSGVGRTALRWFDVVAALFFGWVFVSFVVVWCSGQGAPRAMLTMLAHWCGFAAMFATWRILLGNKHLIRAMLLLFVALIIAESSAAYYHYYHLGPQTRREFYAGLEQATGVSAANQDAASSGERELMKNRIDSIEPLGTYSLTNSLAAVLAPWCVFFCGLFLLGRRQALVVMLPIAFVGFILLMTNSRSGILATLFGIACLFGTMIVASVQNKRVLFGTAVTIFGIVAAGWGIGYATGGLNGAAVTLATKSFGYRLQYWQSGSQMIADHPLVGCGVGNFREYYTQYKLPTASETIADPHNLFFEIATNAGLPALACFIVLLVAAMGYALSSSPKRGDAAPASDAATPNSQRASRQQLPITLFYERLCASRRRYHPICCGGVVGIIAAFAYSYTNYVPLSLDLALFVLLGFLLGFFLFAPVLDSITVPLKTLAPVCLAVLTVDLLASGGIAYPHVNVTFWFLLALCFGLERKGDREKGIKATGYGEKETGYGEKATRDGEKATGRGAGEKSAPLIFSLASPTLIAAFCFLALAAVLYPTAWLANLRANTVLRNMEVVPSQFAFIDKRIAEWEKVVAHDPYRTRVWSDLCAAHLLLQRELPGLAEKRIDTSNWRELVERQMQQSGIKRDLRHVKLNGTVGAALAGAIRSSPLSASNYQNLGMAFLDDFGGIQANAPGNTGIQAKTPGNMVRTRNRDSLDLATALFELAAARYPNHALSYAYLAICHQQSGESELHLKNARRALELDDAMPHSDQKLPDELRRLIESWEL